jgi:hypothetical protein
MYIGVKSDLYQLGMVLYALAMQEDEPENYRPLNVSNFPAEVPDYFLDICYHCLDENPRHRFSASLLLNRFPHLEEERWIEEPYQRPIVVDARSPGPVPYTNGNHMSHGQYGHSNGFYDEYAVTEGSGSYYPRRGRSLGRSRSPPPPITQKHFEPKDIPLPPSTAGSDYLDSIHNTHHANEMLTPVLEIPSPQHEEVLPPQEITLPEDDKTPVSEEPRKTAAAIALPLTPPLTVLADELVGIGGAHDSSPLEIPTANLDDDLTTDTHYDRIASEVPVTNANP